MPCFLIPIHESNDCHNPGGNPDGGRFCSGPGAGGTHAGSHLVRPGETYDLRAVLTGTRLFLFNPSTGQLAVGDAGREDRTHAEVLANAATAQPAGAPRADYDRFRIHGYFTVRNGQPEVEVLRIAASPEVADQDLYAARVDQLDALEEMGPRFAAWGLPPETPITVAGFGKKGLRGRTLGTAFPEAYRAHTKATKAKRRAA
jgi:hypothetical protein